MMKQNEINLINNTINSLAVESIGFKTTFIEMVRIMEESGDCQEYLGFYVRIGNALIQNESVSLEEKKHFLIIHRSIVNIYNQQNGNAGTM